MMKKLAMLLLLAGASTFSMSIVVHLVLKGHCETHLALLVLLRLAGASTSL
jgi:hypothetical protein